MKLLNIFFGLELLKFINFNQIIEIILFYVNAKVLFFYSE